MENPGKAWPSKCDRPGKPLNFALDQKAEGGGKNRFPAGHLEDRAERVPGLFAEKPQDFHRSVVLLRFQKTAVDKQRDGGLFPGRLSFQGLEEF